MKPILESARLTLVPFEGTDLTLLHQTFTNPFIRKYLWDDEIISVEQALEIVEANEKSFEGQGWGLWKIIIKNDNTYAGFAGLWKFFSEDQPQLLFGLFPDKRGHGYASEASARIIEYAFDSLGYTYLMASFDTPNTNSEYVCQRVKMKRIEESVVNNKMTTFFRVERVG